MGGFTVHTQYCWAVLLGLECTAHRTRMVRRLAALYMVWEVWWLGVNCARVCGSVRQAAVGCGLWDESVAAATPTR